MSQTVVPPGPPPVVAAPPGSTSATAASAQARRAGTVAALLSVVRRELAGTPGRLRLISAGAVLAALLGALLGGWALQMRYAALGDANRAATHLVLLQSVQTRLAQADALATNGSLRFGQAEPLADLQTYHRALRGAAGDLARASQGGRQDAAVLGPASAALTDYTGYVESARIYRANAGTRGYAAASVLLATGLMQQDILARVAQRTEADTAAIDDAFTRAGNARWLLIAAVLLGLGGLLAAQRQVSRQSHRYLNVPMAAGTVLLLLGLGIAGANMAGAQSRADDVRGGALATSTELSRARVAAFQAKSIESRTALVPGSATRADPEWTEALRTAQSLRGPGAAVAALQRYAAAHRTINDLATSNRWDASRRAVISDAADSANQAFSDFDRATEQVLTRQSGSATVGLGDARNRLLPAGILLVVLGLVAAGAAWWGVSQRLGEYR